MRGYITRLTRKGTSSIYSRYPDVDGSRLVTRLHDRHHVLSHFDRCPASMTSTRTVLVLDLRIHVVSHREGARVNIA